MIVLRLKFDHYNFTQYADSDLVKVLKLWMDTKWLTNLDFFAMLPINCTNV